MSLLAYHHARRRLALDPEPPVLLRYSAAALSLADGASVTAWPNLGALGAGYDAQPSQPGAATYHAATPSTPAYLRFASPAYLVSGGVLPASLGGIHSRTVLLRYYLETSGNANLLGYGANADFQLFDILAIGGNLLAPHVYGDTVQGGSSVSVGQYATLAVRMTTYAGNAVTTEIFQDEVLTTTRIHNINTATSPLRLGAGMYTDFNSSVPRRLVACAVFGAALTDTQLARQLLTLS